MLHFLISVTGTVLAVSVVTGLLSGYAAQRDLLEVRSPARSGAVAGIAAAALLALLELTTAFVVREYYNLLVLCAALAAEAALFVLLAGTRSLPAEKAASKPLQVLFFFTLALWGAFYLPDLFIFPSHFAVGTVQIASSEFVFVVTGYVLGLLLILLVGHSVFRVCRAVPEKALFPLLAFALLAFALSQTVTVSQILLGRGLLPRRDWALDAVIFLLNHTDILLYAVMAVAAFAALLVWRQSRNAQPAGENPARRRKVLSGMRNRIRWSIASLSALFCSLMVMTAGVYFNTLKVELSPPAAVEAKNGEIRHAASIVGDGALHRFVYKSAKGVDVRYIIIKKSETAFGVGLDACDVCGPSGYYERKGQVICILCDVVMNKSTIGFAGGCNPVPLPFSLKDGFLIINTEDLEAEAPRFM